MKWCVIMYIQCSYLESDTIYYIRMIEACEQCETAKCAKVHLHSNPNICSVQDINGTQRQAIIFEVCVCVYVCVCVCVCACVLCVCACMCMSFQFHIYTCMYINYMVTYNKNFTSEASRHNPHHWHHFRRQRHISEPHIQRQPPYCLFMVWITKTTCTIDKPSDAHLN